MLIGCATARDVTLILGTVCVAVSVGAVCALWVAASRVRVPALWLLARSFMPRTLALAPARVQAALRPVPADVGCERCLQRHADRRGRPRAGLHPGLEPCHEARITSDDVKGRVGAAQMGTIGLHAGTAHVSHIEQPHRAVFDLDPDPSLD
ncbi:hypothetical protein CF640_36860, partial [Burkholderia pseudomallei]